MCGLIVFTTFFDTFCIFLFRTFVRFDSPFMGCLWG
jgi:hypothetical protein